MSAFDHSKLRELFDAAMQRSAAERGAFLDGACGSDAALRARIDDLVKAAEADGTFLSAPTGEMGDRTRERFAAPLHERPGTKIGLYKLLQVIGEGGFGTVFLAEQDKPVRRRVALKILKLGMDTKSIIARFEAERQALALMDHPHIARVLDAGATESGRPFFVMEYVVGDAITRFADAHKLGVQARLELFQQVCQAVQHAHTKGVIHRDLKPGNVLVSMSDGRPFAKVIDFGIAKATSQPLTDQTLFTEHRQLLGTPEYMSPEQAEGSLDIDTRTDVYALGVLLYELLTGATPFDAKRLRSAAYAEMQRIIKEEEPLLPSVRLRRDLTTLAETAAARQLEPAKLNSLVKGELDWIVMKSLDKDRARRYETASALAADVQRHLSGEPVGAAPPSTAYQVRKFIKRNKGPVIAGGAVAMTLLLGIAGTSVAAYVAEYNARAATHNAGLAESARRDLERANVSLSTQTDAAEWSAYTANIALAQASMQANNWPEAHQRLEACPESKRGWEWRFLQSKANSVIAQVPEDAAFTRDGNHIIALGEAPKVYDTAGNPARALFGAADTEMGCFFGEDHAVVVTIDGKKTVRLWTLEGAPIGKPFPHEIAVQSVSISRDGERIATVGADKTVRLWNLTGMQVGTPLLHNEDVSSVQFSPDGNFVLTKMRASAQLWTASGSRVGEPFSHTDKLNSAVFSPDGQLILTCGGFRAQLWNLNAKQVGSPMGERLTVEAAVFSPDGQVVLTRAGNEAFLWNREGASIAPPLSTRGHMETAEFSADGRFVLTASETGLGRLWNLDGTPASPTMRNSSVAAFVPGGRFVLTGASDQTVRLRDFDGRQRTDAVELPGYPSLFTFSVNGGYALAHVTSDVEPNYCLLLNLELRGPEIFMNDSSLLPMELASMVPEYVASIGTDHRQDLPDNSASTVRKSGANGGRVLSALVLGDGSRIIKSFDDSTIRFFLADGLREIAVIRIPATAVDMKLSADGSRLVLKYADRTGMIWDIRDPAERLKDREREWAEQPEADKYVESLLTGPLPTPELDAALRADASLSPLRKLVAWRTLRDRLADMERDASEKFDAITKAAIEKSQTDKPAILAAAAAAEVSPRVKPILLAKAEKWVYVPPRVDENAEKLKQETDRRRLAEADLVEANYGRYDLETAPSAIPALTQAVRTREELLGPAHVKTLDAIMLLSWYYFYEPETTYTILRDAVTRRDLSSDPITSRSLELWDRYANACVNTLRFDEAADWYRRIGKELCMAADYAKASEVSFPAFRSRADRPGEVRGFADMSDCKELASDLQKVDAQAVKLQFAPMEKQQLDQYLLIHEQIDRRDRELIARRTAILAAAAPEDSSALRTVAFGRLRIDDVEGAFAAMARAIALQASKPNASAKDAAPDPIDLAILAVARFRIAEKHSVVPGEAGQLNGRPMNPEENKDAAITEFVRARSLFDRTAEKAGGQPEWSKGERAARFFNDAEEMIQRMGGSK